MGNKQLPKINCLFLRRFNRIHLSQCQSKAFRQGWDGVESLFQCVCVVTYLYQKAELSHMLVVPTCLYANIPCKSFFDMPKVFRQRSSESIIPVKVRLFFILYTLPNHTHESGGRAAIHYDIIRGI